MSRIFAPFSILLGLSLFVTTAFTDTLRVMVMASAANEKGEHLHEDEFDTAIRDLGAPSGSEWSFEKMYTEPERLSTFFASEIDQYDMIVTCPLTQDFGADHTAKLKSWIEAGGALCVTDMMYPGNYEYIHRVNENLFLGADSCGRKTPRYRNPEYTKPMDPFGFLPNGIEWQFPTWGHMWLPGQPGDWKVVKSCQCGESSVFAWRSGKGYIYCSGVRDGRAILLENLRANLEMQRAGLYVESMEGLDAYKLKADDYTVKFKIKAEAAWSGKMVWELRPLETAKKVAVPQKPEKFESLVSLKPGANEISFKFSLNTRGKSYVTLKLAGQGKSPSVTFVSKAVDVAPLVSVKGSRYRNIIGESEYKRYPGITRLPVKISPKSNEKLADMVLSVQVKDEKGVPKGAPIKGIVPPKENFLLPVRTGDLKPGKYSVQYLLKVKGAPKDAGTCDFQVLSTADCPVYINEDLNTVVRGQEIYPLGIYHNDNLDKMKELGFNTVQTWFGVENNFAAQEKGLYTIYESFLRGDWQKAIACTNLLFWYSVDEPREQNYYKGLEQKQAYLDADPLHRPIMMVTMDSVAFTRQGDYADVVGRDPYFFPNGGDKIGAEIDKLWEAVDYDQPVWHVPQAQWMKDPRMYKNAAFQGVVHGARGIFWYCWDDGSRDNEYGGEGLKYETHLHEVAKETNAEITRLAPALLNPNRIQFQSPDQKIDGMLCHDKAAKKMYCILVNRFGENHTINLAEVTELKSRGFTATKTLGPWEVAVLEFPTR